MRSAFIRIFYGLIALLSAGAVFSQIHEIDAEMTLGSGHMLTIDEVKSGFSPREFHARLQQEVEARGINAARLDFDAEDPVHGQVLQFHVGDPSLPSSHWVQDGYPAFDSTQGVRVELIREPLQDPRGSYLLYGPGEQMEGLLESVGETGYSGTQSTMFGEGGLWETLTGSPLSWAFLGAVLGIAFAVACSVTMSVRVYGQKFLFGDSPARVFLREAGAGLIAVAVGFVATQLIAAILLFFYNGLAFYRLFIEISLVVSLLVSFLVLMVHMFTFLLVSRISISDAIKGKVPVGASYVAINVVKFGCIVGLLVMLQTSSSASGLIAKYHETSAVLERLGQVSYIDQRGGARENADIQAVEGWLTQEVTRGNVVISQNDVISVMGGDDMPISTLSVLLVDKNYLRLHPDQVPEATEWVDAEGNDADPAVFFPEGSEATVKDMDLVVPYGFREHRIETFTEHHVPAGRDVFTYGSSANRDPLRTRDPVLVYLPMQDLLPSINSVSAWASQGGAMIEERVGAMERLAQSPVRNVIASLKPVKSHQAAYLKKYETELRTSLYGAAAFGVVLILALLAYAVLYCRENGQEIFVKHLSGWGFLGTFRALLGVEILVMTGVVAYQAYRTAGESQGVLSTGADDGVVAGFLRFSWGSIGALVLLDLALLLGALLISSRRDITERTRTE